ncbi:MAG: 2-C-methyl-D-erythritol 2,4-cyclodiphosphate synthase [Defluviitaleaceae bacterium]|nr:2-C-methyl-D-erythritol 2,4-cyclodiphosphate synthase [Defluviitaleaceae bacterium]
MRIGIGYDAHKLVENRLLILGGCTIPFEKGLLGHSDADVLTHAIMDAILGAAAMGDIGQHFPDNDPKHKNASSLHMLLEVKKMINEADLSIGNIDGVIVAQRPKLADFLPIMTENIANVLDVSIGSVNIKATTEEGMGFTGNGEGIAAKAVALLR